MLPAEGDSEAAPKGVSLSRLLDGVSAAIADVFAVGVWTTVEVMKVSGKGGHIYLELAERDSAGAVLAKANGSIWAKSAARILPEFEKATGAILNSGIKLLVRAKPVFKAQYGFNLEIDAIDPSYTLGDLEARKKAIRAQLQREGVFEQNKQLAAPWDFNSVVVVAPHDAAGLGDFRKEADRLERFGLCRFHYAHSRFQGDGAAQEIVAALTKGLRERQAAGDRPDAIVIIRGGGAVNDLAWLNDYDLARFICDRRVPVLTGIGHERDSTVLDEVAFRKFDTPSKVIAGIEKLIVHRAREAKAYAESIMTMAVSMISTARAAVDKANAQIASDARSSIAKARQASDAAISSIGVSSMQSVHRAARGSLALINQIRHEAVQQTAIARQAVPQHLAEIKAQAAAGLAAARATSNAAMNTVTDIASGAARSAQRQVDVQMEALAERARSATARASSGVEALMREIAGQGPERTLGRGFAIVKTSDGKAISRLSQITSDQAIAIHFRDGVIDAKTLKS